ncbi:HAMP domain-containing protein [bacterium]|nr:HAMP domain-containing protein [bacterium]
MKSSKMKSLQVKFNLTFIVITVLISLIFNLLIYFMVSSQKVEDLKGLASFTTERLSKNFVAPMWDMEIEKLKDIIRFEMGEKQIFAILIKDAENKNTVAGAQRDVDWKIVDVKDTFDPKLIMMSKEIVKEGEKLGTVVVYFSSRFMDSELRQSLISTTGAFAALAMILILSLYFILKNVVIKPVNAVVGLTEKLNDGDLSARLEMGEDEIGKMIGSINGFTANLQNAVKQINLSMKAVASGNLTDQITVELKGDLNELKTSINDSIQMLGHTISEVVNSSEKVKTGSSEISTSANTLANGTTQQAAAIEEMSSSINEFSAQTKANNENASQAQQLSNKTLEIVQRGNLQMESMLKSINEINSTSSEVAKVIKVIDEIAFQTNLLALNAAVEAARAGQYGKGFAVVAEEVRNLAGRSGEAAKSTTELIEASIKEVEKGVKNADLTAAVLNEISESIDKTNDLVGEISSASKEQATGIDEINRGLSQINEIVQQNSSISEETASSSEELSNQATQLQKLMSRFKLAFDARAVAMKREAFSADVEPTFRRASTQPKKASPALKYEPVQKSVESKRNILVLDDDDFGKY